MKASRPEKTFTCRCGAKSRPFREGETFARTIEEYSGFHRVIVEGLDRWLCGSCFDACVMAAGVFLDVFGAEDARDIVVGGGFIREAEDAKEKDDSWRDGRCRSCPICGSEASPDSSDW